MEYQRMWENLKQNIQQQQELSENITINKLLSKIKDIEEVEKYVDSSDLPF